VLACKARKHRRGGAGKQLLIWSGSSFIPADAPSGQRALDVLARGGALRLDVECLECELTDLGTDDLGTSEIGEGTEPPGRGG